MSNPSNAQNSRENSQAKFLLRQQAQLIKEEEAILAIQRAKYAKNELTKQEEQQMRDREQLIAKRRELNRLNEESQHKTVYSMQNVSTMHDDSRIDAFLSKKTSILDEFSISSQFQPGFDKKDQGKGFGKGGYDDRVFESINLLLHSRSAGNSPDSLEGLPTEERLRVEEKMKDEATMATMSKFDKIQYQRKKLPAYQLRNELLATIRENQVVIIEGETGSGKTTQIMQYLYEDGYCEDNMMVACTQPRRVAATSVATRVAEEKGVKLGEEVGYHVRFDNNTSDKTQIKYLTDGMILRELLTNPTLDRYSCIMIDEAHERTVSTDILLGILKPLLTKRADLKVLIASATINIEKFSKFFNNAPTFKIPGRTCNIDIYYTQTPENDYVEAAILTMMQIHQTQRLDGDILVFLPGQEEIQQTHEVLLEKYKMELEKRPNMPQLLICPIYANLPAEEQAKIFLPTPSNVRKIVLATNIAETSLTIDGIVYVIDCGWCKTLIANSTGNAGLGMEALVTVPISKASANQRAGRAGRVRDGKCFRLYTFQSYCELDDQNIPEIQRCNLSPVVLLLKSLGINRFVDFDWVDPPSVHALNQSITLLYALGALSSDGRLTKTGYKMTILPLDPMVAKMLIKSQFYQCSHDIITIAALLSVGGSILTIPSKKNLQHYQQATAAHNNFQHKLGDHFTLLNVYKEFCIQLTQQEVICKDLEQSMILAPSHSKTQQLHRAKKLVLTWCIDNFVQYKMLLQAHDIITQLKRVCSDKDVEITPDEHEKLYHEQIGQFLPSSSSSSPSSPPSTSSTLPQIEQLIQAYEKKICLSVMHGFFPNIAKYSGLSAGLSSSGPNTSATKGGHVTYTLLKNSSQQAFIHPHSCMYRPSTHEQRDIQRRLRALEDATGASGSQIANSSNFDVKLDSLDKLGPPPSYILYHELIQTKKEYLRGILVIEREWIGTVAPHFYPMEAQLIKEEMIQQLKTKSKAKR